MNTEVLQKIQLGSTYDFQDYIERFNLFYRNYFIKLVNYWKFIDKELEPSVLIEFNQLYNDFLTMQDAFERRVDGSEYDLDFFDFAEYLADIKMSLDIIKNLPKYLKTSSNDIDKFEEPVIEYLVKQGDTLEKISKRFYGDSEYFGYIMDYNNIRYTEVNASDWIGRKIKIPARRIIQKDIEGIIDGLIGDNVLGKDIKSEFTFVSDDIETVEYEDCAMQTVIDFITSIEKGTVPEFPQVGNISKKIIGRGYGAMSLSFLINDYMTLFKLDPTIEVFTVTDVKLQDDALLIDFTFRTINGYEIKNSFPIEL